MAVNMGLYFLAALAALSLCNGYVYDRDYRYKYTAFLSAGLPGKESQLAGSSINAELWLQPYRNYDIFQLVSPKIDRINRESKFIVDEEFQYREHDDLTEFLTKPIKVFYERGEIHHFLAARDDPEWSVNIKKALLSMFQLNLEQNNVIRTSEDEHLTRPDTSEHYFRVMEKDIGGNCESLYVIDHYPYEGTRVETHVLNITKTRNYHNCDRKPYKMYMAYRGDECAECETDKSHPVHSNSFYYYEIRGDRHNYLIERVSNEGELVYAPFSTEAQTLEILHNHTLVLIEESETRRDIPISPDTVPYYSLEYIYPDHRGFEELVDLKKPHYLYSLYGFSAPVTDVERLFREVVADYDDEKYGDKFHTHNITAKFLELVKAFSTLSYDEIDQVYQKVWNNEDNLKNLFLDVISVTGTNPAFVYGKYLIQSRRLSIYQTFMFISTIHKHIKEPTEILLDEYYRLCDHSFVREEVKLQTVCHLTLASLVYETCVARSDEVHTSEDRTHCDPSKAVKYYQYVAKHFNDIEDEYHHVTHIKTAGNFGLKEVIEYLRNYIEEDDHNTYIRVSAIYSLRKVAIHYPEEVFRLLMPLYFNHTEDYEVRIAAFSVIMIGEVALSHIETIAFSLWDEPSTQVRSFVYSTFHYLANSTHPCHKSIARDIRQVFTMLDDTEHDYSHLDAEYSFNYFTAGYNKHMDLGGYTQFAYIPSNSSYMPRAWYLGVNDFIVGRSFDLFGVGYQGMGLDKYLDRLFGPTGLFNRKASDWTFTPREDVNTDVHKDLKEVDKKIKVVPREYEPIHGNLFIKYMDNEVYFWYFNETIIDNFFRHGLKGLVSKWNALGDYKWRRHTITTDKTVVIFSEIGLPIMLEVKQPIYMQYINHELKVEPQPEGTPMFENLKVHLDGHFAYDRNFFLTFGIVIPYHHVAYGVGTNRRSVVSLPTKLDFHVDLRNTKMTVKWIPVPHHVFHVHQMPFTFIDQLDNYVPLIQEPTFLPFPQHEFGNFDKEYFHDALGVGIRVDAEMHHTWNSRGEWWEFLTETDFRDKYYYYTMNPYFRRYNIDTYLSSANRDITNEFELTLNYDHYGPKSNKVYTPKFDDGFEEQGREVTDRKWETHVLKAELYGRGQRERKIKAEISFSRSDDTLHRKWNFFYDRNPFRSGESDDFKICWSTYNKFPKYDFTKLFKLETSELDHKLTSVTKLNFGRDCKSDNKVDLTVTMDRSDFQKAREADREKPLSIYYRNTYGFYYQKCMELRQKGVMYSMYCRDYINLVTRLHHEHWVMEYQNIQPWVYNWTYKVVDFARHFDYPYLETNHLATNEPNKVVMELENFVEHRGFADAKLYEPQSTVFYNHFPLPRKPISASPLFDFSNWDDYLQYYEKPYCLLHGDHVRTFDNVSYTLPEIGCYKVLAKDCSLNNDFTILGSKVGDIPNYTKALRMFFGKHKLEAIPTAEGINVRLDGTAIPVTEAEPYYHEEDDHELLHVNFNGFYYTFESHVYGLTVYYDGNAIYIRPSFYYRGKICGLCGNYDGDEVDEFEGPERCSYNDTEAFSYRYVVPDSTCQVPEVPNACDHQRMKHCVVLRNHKVMLGSRNKQVCFSVAPVTRCTEGCKPTRLVTRNVGYHCLPAKDEFTRYLQRETEIRELHEIRRKSKDHYADIEYPESCIPEEH